MSSDPPTSPTRDSPASPHDGAVLKKLRMEVGAALDSAPPTSPEPLGAPVPRPVFVDLSVIAQAQLQPQPLNTNSSGTHTPTKGLEGPASHTRALTDSSVLSTPGFGASRVASLHTLSALVDNPTPQQQVQHQNGDRLIIVMVGLPARGKTFLARRICQYLSFFHGATCRVFNVGSYRRERVGAKTPAEFFRSDNAAASEVRKQLAQECMTDLKRWVTETVTEGRVAVYDATNTTKSRRDWILCELASVVQSRNNVLFVESVVNDEKLVENNVKEVKVSMPDYDGMTPDAAVADFKARIAAYQTVYEPMGSHPDDNNLCWVRVEDGGLRVTMNRIRGYLQGRICQLLSTLHTMSRPIYLTRHGQSEYNVKGKIGGDSKLSEWGEEYAEELAKYVHTKILGLNEDGSFPDPNNRTCVHAKLYTSSLFRTKETAKHIVHNVCDDGWIIMRPHAWRNLDEIFAGSFDGYTYAEIEAIAPEEFADRAKNKLAFRYPRGESYLDVIDRLEPVVMELERQRDPVLVVGHQGVLRILYAYFTGKPRNEAPHVPIPLNTVIKLVPGTYSCAEERIRLMDDSEDHPPAGSSSALDVSSGDLVAASASAAQHASTPHHGYHVVAPEADVQDGPPSH